MSARSNKEESWVLNNTRGLRKRPMFYSVRLSGRKAYAKLNRMVVEDAPVASKLLISSQEDTMLSEPTPEMRMRYVQDITSGSEVTLESFPVSYLELGHKVTMIRSTRKAATRRSSKTSTGKPASTSLKGSKAVRSQLTKQGS